MDCAPWEIICYIADWVSDVQSKLYWAATSKRYRDLRFEIRTIESSTRMNLIAGVDWFTKVQHIDVADAIGMVYPQNFPELRSVRLHKQDKNLYITGLKKLQLAECNGSAYVDKSNSSLLYLKAKYVPSNVCDLINLSTMVVTDMCVPIRDQFWNNNLRFLDAELMKINSGMKFPNLEFLRCGEFSVAEKWEIPKLYMLVCREFARSTNRHLNNIHVLYCECKLQMMSYRLHGKKIVAPLLPNLKGLYMRASVSHAQIHVYMNHYPTLTNMIAGDMEASLDTDGSIKIQATNGRLIFPRCL